MAEYKPKTVQELIGTGDTWMSQLFQGVKAYTTMMNTINMTKWNEEAKTEQAEKYSLDRLQNLRLQFTKHKDNRALLMQDWAQWEAYGKTKFVSPLIIEQYIDGTQDFETYHARLDSQDAYDKWVNKQTNGGNDVTMIENYFKLDSEGFQAKLEKDRSELNEWRETYKRNGWLDKTTKTMFNNHDKYLKIINVLGGHDNHIQTDQQDRIKGLWKDFLADGKVPNLATQLNSLNTHIINTENRIIKLTAQQEQAMKRSEEYSDGQYKQYTDAEARAKAELAVATKLGLVIGDYEEKLEAAHAERAANNYEKEFDWGGHPRHLPYTPPETTTKLTRVDEYGVNRHFTINTETGDDEWGERVESVGGEGDKYLGYTDDEILSEWNTMTQNEKDSLGIDTFEDFKSTYTQRAGDESQVRSTKKNPNKSGDVLFKDLSQSEKDKVIAAHRDAINNDIYNYKLSSMSPQKWYNSKIESGKEEVKPSLKKKVTKKKKSGGAWETAQKSINMWKRIITNINDSKKTAEQKEKDIAKYQAKIDAKLAKFE
jgi:hypothetical protein